MKEQHLHIISFNVPFPANYGGVIDVFYKIKNLYNNGIKIILHCFDYGRGVQTELNQYCETVYYYQRNMFFINGLKSLPYIVISRKNEQLIQNLLADNYPIFFEGIHTCYYLTDKRLRNRLKVVRAHNIETEYYARLAQNEKSLWKKIYFKVESGKLRKFEQNLKFADIVFTVTEKDTEYFSKFCRNVVTIPSFHTNEKVSIKSGRGDYILYQGDLSSNENITAVKYLIDNIFSKISNPVIIAGMNPPPKIVAWIKPFSNIQLIPNPSDEMMDELIQNAHINLLITFQPTGLKLKLLHALSSGRFCLVNSCMLHGTKLHEVCTVADTPEQMIEKIKYLLCCEFSEKDIENRKTIFNKLYSNQLQYEKIAPLLFSET